MNGPAHALTSQRRLPRAEACAWSGTARRWGFRGISVCPGHPAQTPRVAASHRDCPPNPRGDSVVGAVNPRGEYPFYDLPLEYRISLQALHVMYSACTSCLHEKLNRPHNPRSLRPSHWTHGGAPNGSIYQYRGCYHCCSSAMNKRRGRTY